MAHKVETSIHLANAEGFNAAVLKAWELGCWAKPNQTSPKIIDVICTDENQAEVMDAIRAAAMPAPNAVAPAATV